MRMIVMVMMVMMMKVMESGWVCVERGEQWHGQ